MKNIEKLRMRLGNTLSFVLISIIAGLVSFAFLPILTRSLSTTEFAEFSKALLYVQVATTCSVFGFSAYLTTVFAKADDPSLIRSAMSVWLFLFVAFFALCLTLGLVLDLIYEFVALGVFSGLRALHVVGGQVYRLFDAKLVFAIYQIGVPFVFFILAVISACYISGSGLFAFCIASVTYLLISVNTVSLFRRRNWIAGIRLENFSRSPYAKFAAGASLHAIAGIGITTWDKAYVASALSNEEFAIYVAAAQYAGGLVLIFTAISQAVVPNIYKLLKNRSERMLDLLKYVSLVAAVMTILFLGYELLVGWVFELMMPKSFSGGALVARILGVSAFFQGLYFIPSAIVFYFHKTISMALITLVCGISGALMGVILRPTEGLMIGLCAIVVWFFFFLLTSRYAYKLVRGNH